MLRKIIIAAVILVMGLAVGLADADEQYQWYAQQGKGRPLCENLVRIANANPSIGITPNIPWKQVLSIKGVQEPKWKELAPLQYEEFFLKARDSIATYNGKSESITFARWFLPPKERYADESIRKKPISDEEALKIYRDFVRRGGKLKMFRYEISGTGEQIFMDFVQYESMEKDSSDWDGYSLKAKPGLSGIHEAWYSIGGSIFRGRGYLTIGYRILMYKNNVFSFIRDYGEYRVDQLSGERDEINNEKSPYYLESYYCKIDIKVP